MVWQRRKAVDLFLVRGCEEFQGEVSYLCRFSSRSTRRDWCSGKLSSVAAVDQAIDSLPPKKSEPNSCEITFFFSLSYKMTLNPNSAAGKLSTSFAYFGSRCSSSAWHSLVPRSQVNPPSSLLLQKLVFLSPLVGTDLYLCFCFWL